MCDYWVEFSNACKTTGGEDKLSVNEKKVFDNFLKKMRDLGVIRPNVEAGRGSYRFLNELYRIYIALESHISYHSTNKSVN